jgi:N-acetyl-anhydromuramyl-L-alanine amidase AmpD
MLAPIPFLQARHFRKGPRAKVDLVVIHSAEVGETLEAAEALMRRCAVTDRVASWHYAVDADSATCSVREEDVAFHAPGANSNAVGVELCGTARQNAAEWDDDFSRRTLARAAELVADVCARWVIPVEAVDHRGLLAGRRGITTHASVSLAFQKSDHTDPGPHFPLSRFLELVRAAEPPAAPVPASVAGAGATRPALARGARGTAIVELQRLLNAAGADPPLGVDGDFGEKTERALRAFQAGRALAATGATDAATWIALLA